MASPCFNVDFHLKKSNVQHLKQADIRILKYFEKKQGQKGFQSTSMSHKAIRNMSSAPKRLPVPVLT